MFVAEEFQLLLQLLLLMVGGRIFLAAFVSKQNNRKGHKLVQLLLLRSIEYIALCYDF